MIRDAGGGCGVGGGGNGCGFGDGGGGCICTPLCMDFIGRFVTVGTAVPGLT